MGFGNHQSASIGLTFLQSLGKCKGSWTDRNPVSQSSQVLQPTNTRNSTRADPSMQYSTGWLLTSGWGRAWMGGDWEGKPRGAMLWGSVFRWAVSPIANVQRARSTFAGHSAVPRGTNVARMNANRAIRIAAQRT